jgi:hypothetical protein
MFLPENNSDDFAPSNFPHFPSKKLKPHQPASPVGKRYVKYFWHPFGAIITTTPVENAKPSWRTTNHYLQPSTLWRLHQNSTKQVGVRFGSTTDFAVIDLDAGGDYHSNESVNRIKAALEDIGIVDIIPIQSSFSGGYHLIITFTSPQPTFNLACALEQTLKDAGFLVRKGHLEIFPNVKPWGENCIINYNAIRCPMQAGSGALLLDDDLQPISDDVSIFLDHCYKAAARQDLTLLKRACKKARKRHNQERYHKKASASVEEWRANWEEIIATGWTGQGQTNTILQVLVGYGIVFLGLEGENLVNYALKTATNAPGYTKYCRHQHEIEARVRDWVECTIRHQWYTPYASYPPRLLGTFANTFATAIANGRNLKKTKNNVIPFDRRITQSEQRSQQAQRRIKWAVKAIEWETGLAPGAKARAQQICVECKRQFNKSLSLQTLHKYLQLWHPKSYIEDPWAENSSNPCPLEGYRCLDNFETSEKNQNAQNPYQMEGYGFPPYMKVCGLLPAASAPQGLEAAEVLEETGVCQQDLGATQVAENLEIINSSNTVENHSNELSNQPENSSNSSILPSNQLSSHQDFIYSYSSGASPKNDKKNLSNMRNNGLGAVSTPAPVTRSYTKKSGSLIKTSTRLRPQINETKAARFLGDKCVTPEPPFQSANNRVQNLSEGNATEYASSSIEEIKQMTKLRLMAVTHAKTQVRRYCMIIGRNISGIERSRLEMIAKMQFYLDSGDKVLVAEASRWAAANPGCLPFSLESAFSERAEE